VASRKKRIIKLGEHEHIIACVPHYAAGPGWSNALVWVWLRDTSTGEVRMEDIQSEDFTIPVAALFRVVETAHTALLSALCPAIIKEYAGKKERR